MGLEEGIIKYKNYKKILVIFLLGIFALGSIYISPNGSTDTISTSFTYSNTAPNPETSAQIQDGATNWDSTNIDTHYAGTGSAGPYLNWTAGSDADGDTVYHKLCIATTSTLRNGATEADTSGCDVVNLYANTSALSTSYYQITTTLFNISTGNRSYYARLKEYDNQSLSTAYDFTIKVMNFAPTVASVNLTTEGANKITHTVRPVINISVTDPDDGTNDHYPADSGFVVTASIGTVGYADASNGGTFNNTIGNLPWSPTLQWGPSDGTWSNNTYYLNANASDISSSSTNYQIQVIVYNKLPTTPGAINTTATHDTTPSVTFTASTDADSDPLIYEIAFGSTDGASDYLSETQNTTAMGNFNGSTIAWGASYSGGWVNRTVYGTIKVRDVSGLYGVGNNTTADFTLMDKIPTAPSTLNTTETHDRSPSLAWTDCAETDGDTITRYMACGSSDNAGDYYANSPASNSLAGFGSNNIAWGSTASGQWANRSVYCTLWCKDNASGIQDSSNNYTTADFTLFDILPNITTVQITNNGDPYTDQAIDPTTNGNATVAVKVTASDADGDCSTDHVAYLHICRNATAGEVCYEGEGDYIWQIDSITGTTTCTAVFSANKTNGLEFWRAPGDYKAYVNMTGAGGDGGPVLNMPVDADRNSTFAYNSLQALNINSTLAFGSLSAGSMKNMTNATQSGFGNFSNVGNVILSLAWNATDFTNTTYGQTANIDTNTSLYLDDDWLQAESPEKRLASKQLFSNATTQTFNPSAGLTRCTSNTCTNDNATYWGYFHLQIPLGLTGNGVYSNSITVAKSQYS